MKITAETSLEEIAALVSQALDDAGIDAILSGGGAVTLYSNNEYMSTDLDFITTERNKRIAPVVAKLGFVPPGREYEHPESKFFIEFPSGPLAFGDRYLDNDEATTVQTKYGAVRIITPTQSVMDRIAWFVHGGDRQSRDQAITHKYLTSPPFKVHCLPSTLNKIRTQIGNCSSLSRSLNYQRPRTGCGLPLLGPIFRRPNGAAGLGPKSG